ncbi:MAG: aminotransferase class I/II-fold pyridoxal phosphate-dependent enzyme [Actinomycetota bacterium]|nr:aminotransferase class I/II-fold pyridoxal phosphate-dependent enzyme [Rubrobacteraceae bacterium]MDQ3498146.1 aminotransferase class I/II-fold pyridoxal phosphate-dependent enzyme [Actinomycetota bacterium]
MAINFRPELDPLSPYRPPRAANEAAAERGAEGYVKLTSNELSFGPLPEAEAAIAEALPRANRYPDRYVAALREEVVSANPGSAFENILVGNGSSEILLNLLQLVERPGEVIFPWPSFGLYASIGITLGLKTTKVPLTDDHEIKPEALLSAVTDDTRAVIASNPNNPTGTYLTLDEVRTFAEALPDNVLLILDEAYQEFVSDPAYGGSHELALERENVVCVRTFSKAHGLAGFRVGYGIAGQRMADYVERVRFPFSVNLAAQVAASASMRARDKIEARARFVMGERDRIQDAFRQANLNYIPSQGNFVLVQTGPEIFERGRVLVREGDPLGYPGWSRVTVGDSGENERVIRALGGA